MNAAGLRAGGLVLSTAYAAFLAWVYVVHPQSLAEVKGGMASSIGLYAIDLARFEEGRKLFAADRFDEARAAFERADPAHRDPVTQYYVAYSYYRQGWGRLYNDDALFRQALQALDRATQMAPDGRVHVNDPALGLPDSDALRGELQHGVTLEARDFNPMRLLRRRQ
jgi:tetratricopeptide (TPR) repeat protein